MESRHRNHDREKIEEKEKEIEEIEIGIKIGFVLNGVNVMGKPLKVG